MSRTEIELQTGPEPDWELSQDQESLRSVFSSSVLSFVLKQSRQKWLTTNMTKFSSKTARGKVTENSSLPPHTIHARGKCDLEIGPHVFYDTAFYEVHYLSAQSIPQSTYTPQWSSYASFASTSTSTTGSSSVPLLSSISPKFLIDQTLVNQVNAAAASNPTLANLLQIAQRGEASDAQLEMLGLLIRTLATSPQASYGATSTASVPPSREFDLVLEFRENPSDRWIFPRGKSTCERVLDHNATDGAYDITLTCHTSLNKSPSQGESTSQSSSNEPETLTLKFVKAPTIIWDLLLRWIGGEQKNRENRETLNKVKAVPSAYLAYRLPDGPLLDQLKAATELPYPMKSIKPSNTANSSRSRRRPSQKKPSDSVAPTRKKSTDVKTTTNEIQNKDNPTTPGPAPKKPRQSKSKSKASVVQIRCLTCNQADVPLMLGGRFCRPCVEAGKANPDIPLTQSGQATSYVPLMYASPRPFTAASTSAAVPPTSVPPSNPFPKT